MKAAAKENKSSCSTCAGKSSTSFVQRQAKPQPSIQTKLKVGSPNDKYEKEADTMAARVMRMPMEQSAPIAQQSETPGVQLKACCGCGGGAIQMKSMGGNMYASSNIQSTLSSSKGKGAPLTSGLNRQMSTSFGSDFSGVRVHTDSDAVQMNQQLNAKAFTNGSDIYFNKGQYNPYNSSGKELLAHELTHVVQQGGGSETIQRESFGGWLGDSASALADMGSDALMSAVEYISPSLANLIRKGPKVVLSELMGGSIQSWINEKLCNYDLNHYVQGFTKDVGDAFSMLQGVTKGDAESCTAFAHKISGLRSWIKKLSNNPIINGIIDGINGIKAGIGDVLTLVGTPMFDGLMAIGGVQMKIIKVVASNIADWGGKLNEYSSSAWVWVKEKLGIVSDASGSIWNFVKEKANDAWTTLKDTFSPISSSLKNVAITLGAFSPAAPIIAIIKYGPQILDSVQWLWANRDNPNITKAAHEEMGHTILPQLLDGLSSAKRGFVQGIGYLKSGLLSLGNDMVKMLNQFANHPIFGPIRSCVQLVSDGLNSFLRWASNDATSLVQTIQEWYKKWEKYLKPIIEVFTSLGLAIAQPQLIPVMLTGWAWKLLPDCYKLPIIDLILDAVIGFLRKAPNLPFFRGLWDIVKEGIIGSLEKFRQLKTPEGQADSQNPKVLLSNKFASIISGSNLGFMVGFAKGFLQGLWEGISDPFKIAFELFNGLANLPTWLSRMGTQAPSTQKNEGVKGMSSTNAATSDSKDQPPLNMGDEIEGLGKDIEPDIELVKKDSNPAVNEAMSGDGGSEGITLDKVIDTLGALKSSAMKGMRDAGGRIAESIIQYMMKGEATMDLGNKVGWLSGTITFEVVLALLTAGVANAASWGAKALKYILKIVDWMGEAMGLAFKYLARLGKYIIKIAQKIGTWLSKGKGAIANVLRALRNIGEKIIAFVQRVLNRGGKKGAGEAGEAAAKKTTKEAAEEAAEKAGNEGAEEGAEQGAKKGSNEYNLPDNEIKHTKKELLDNSINKRVDEMSPHEVQAELKSGLDRGKAKPVDDVKYDLEIKADNGHTWKRDKKTGTWCRFSNADCGIDIKKVLGDVDNSLYDDMQFGDSDELLGYIDDIDAFGDEGRKASAAEIEAAENQAALDAGVREEFVGSAFDANGNLRPNVKYKTGEFGYIGETDGFGRVNRVRTDELKISPEARLKHNSKTPGKLDGDHAGHLFGDRFGGSAELDNIVSQTSDVNLSEFRKIENGWAKDILSGNKVEVDIKVNYTGDILRPTSFDVKWKVNGESEFQKITNSIN